MVSVKCFSGVGSSKAQDLRQKVTCGLPGWTMPSHVFKVLPCFVCRTKIDLPAFVKNNGFVTEVIDCLRCLVDGDKRGYR